MLALALVLALAAEDAGLSRKLALSCPTEALAAGPRALELELDRSCEWLLELRECRAGTKGKASDVELGRRACFSRREALAKLSRGRGAPRVLE